jgi:DNA-binding LacI/PurR family transcriptional regulator
VKITLKDIADDVGVSLATVSRVLASKGPFNPETERKIIDSAYRLGYPGVKFLRHKVKHSLDIAIITPMWLGEFDASLFRGFIEASNDSKFNIRFVNMDETQKDPVNYLSRTLEDFDGACIFIPYLTSDDYIKLKSVVNSYPLISLAPITDPILETVTFDSYRGGYLVAKHFHELGFKKTGIIVGESIRLESKLRKNGFMNYINDTDSMECLWEYQGDFSFDSGVKAYHDINAREIENIAIFGSNDVMALGFMREAIRDGKHIPTDFAISGYDDLPFSKLYDPHLTSVSTDFFKLGKYALKQILKQIEHNDTDEEHISLVPVSLISRESSTGEKTTS